MPHKFTKPNFKLPLKNHSVGIADMTTCMDNVCKSIKFYEGFNPVEKGFKKIVKWRDNAPGIGRRVVLGAALVGLSLGFLIDSVTSLALAIITSPLELFGIKFARNFAVRSFIGCAHAGFCLSIFQRLNIVEQKFL